MRAGLRIRRGRAATARQSSTTTPERLEEQFRKRFPGNIGLEDSIEVRLESILLKKSVDVADQLFSALPLAFLTGEIVSETSTKVLFLR